MSPVTLLARCLGVLIVLAGRSVAGQASPCYPQQRAQTDSLRALPSPTVTAVTRLATRIDSLGLACRAPAPPPAPRPTLTLTVTDTVLYVRPTVPYHVFVYAVSDSAGVRGDSARYSLSDTTLAKVYWLPVQRRFQVSEAARSGVLTIVGHYGSAADTVTVRVVGPAAPPPPPPLGKLVQIDPSQRFQVMTGWRAGELLSSCSGYTRYRDALITRLVNDYNITHRSIEVRSGMENVADYYSQHKAGLISDSAYRATWFVPVNDNADPFVTDSSKWHWALLDDLVTREVLPWRAAVLAAGKVPTVTLLMTDFMTPSLGNMSRPFQLLKSANEYAEWVTMAFLHMQRTYGWVPDVVEITLEPENSQVYGPDVGRAINAARARLAGKGFAPEFAAPSNVTARNTVAYMQQITATGAAPEWVTFHRYIAPRPDSAVLAGIRALPGKKVMSEYNETTNANDAANLIFDDLTQADVGAWVLYIGSACGRRDNPDNAGVLLQVNITDSLAPKINDTYRSVLLREVYQAANRGDVRVGAAVGDTASQVVAFQRPNGAISVAIRSRQGGTYTIRGLPPGTYDLAYALAQSLTRVTLPALTKTDAGDVQVTIPGNGVLSLVSR